MKKCDDCGNDFPLDKFNLESRSPSSCFKCRIGTVKIGFGGRKESFHGDALAGGTVASDNRHTVAEARKNGYNPVPVKNGESSWTPSASSINKLKTALGGV